MKDIITLLNEIAFGEADTEKALELIRTVLQTPMPVENAETELLAETLHVLFCHESHSKPSEKGSGKCEFFSEVAFEDTWSRPSHKLWKRKAMKYVTQFTLNIDEIKAVRGEIVKIVSNMESSNSYWQALRIVNTELGAND